MTEPIDIESLDPLYRDVFRNPANGTPDDISKAGCFALAKLGKDAWNAWRVKYPACETQVNGLYSNRADFSNCQLDETFWNFRAFNFGDGANFSEIKSIRKIDFNFATFGKVTSFRRSIFDGGIEFNGAEFADMLLFNDSKFGTVSFKDCKFMGWSSFKNCEFNLATFTGSSFEDVVDFSLASFSTRLDFGYLPQKRVGKSATRRTKFQSAPRFFGSKIHQNTTFDGAIFPPAIGLPSEAYAYRTLKLAFSKQQAIREEQRFFKLEVAEEAKAAPWYKKPLYAAYWAFSEYGFSVARPFILLLVTLSVCAALYGASAGLSACLPFQNACSIDSAWAEFSLLQSFPLPGLDKLSDTLRGQLFPSEGLISIGVTLAVILHKAISLLALFLMGLALRNLFKLK